ncbi:MAG: Ig-like domain-containing protein, partial [Myxococcota bacterium]
YRGSPTDFSLSWDRPGRSLLRTLVMDAEGCGSEDAQVLYVGDVGVPVGPISVVPAFETLVAGGTGADTETEVMVSALECTGDSAADGTVSVRTEIGDVSAAEESSLLASGSGLLLSLDSDGSGRFYWGAGAVEEGGIAVVHVGGGSGGAYGWSFVEIEGDSLAPNVVSISPAGTTTGILSSVSISFTEPMYRFASVSDMREWVQVINPVGDVHVWEELVWGPEDQSIHLNFDEPIDASSGEWTVLLTDDLRDAAGNRLPETVVHRFGSVPDEIGSAFGCKPSVGWFFPDGDDGEGFESDGVSVHVVTDRSAEWWQVEIVDEASTMIRHASSFRGGLLSGAVSWDGRDQGGRVVGEGTYQMSITPVDEFNNLGTPCVVSVGVMHRFDEVVGL